MSTRRRELEADEISDEDLIATADWYDRHVIKRQPVRTLIETLTEEERQRDLEFIRRFVEMPNG